MKYFAVLILIGILAPTCLATCLSTYPSSCSWIGSGYANIPLCFKSGWPSNCVVPKCGCYTPSLMPTCTNNANTPCLPPIIGGRLIPPCTGPFAVIQQCWQQTPACY